MAEFVDPSMLEGAPSPFTGEKASDPVVESPSGIPARAERAAQSPGGNNGRNDPALSDVEIFNLALGVWGDPEIAATMVAIALAESGGIPTRDGDSSSDRGLFQINYIHHEGLRNADPPIISNTSDLYDPATNAAAAYWVASRNNDGIDLSRWAVTDNSDGGAAYKRYEDRALAAAQQEGYTVSGDFSGRDGYGDIRSFGSSGSGSGTSGANPGSGANIDPDSGVPANLDSDNDGTDPLSEMTDEQLQETVITALPFFLSFMEIPELREIFISAARDGRSTDEGYIRSKLMVTEWWKSRSESQRVLVGEKATDPKLYYDKLVAVARELRGIYLDLGYMPPAGDPFSNFDVASPLYAQAEAYLLTGMKAAEMTDMLTRATVLGVPFDPANATPSGTLASSMESVITLAASFMVMMTDAEAFNFAQQIAIGDITKDGVRDLIRDQAISKFAYDDKIVERIRAGFTPDQLFSQHKQVIAQTLGQDVDSIDFMNNPTYGQVLNGGADGKSMSVNEAETYIRGTPQGRKSRTVQKDGAAVWLGLRKSLGLS